MKYRIRSIDGHTFTFEDQTGLLVGHVRINEDGVSWHGSYLKIWHTLKLDQFAQLMFSNGTVSKTIGDELPE